MDDVSCNRAYEDTYLPDQNRQKGSNTHPTAMEYCRAPCRSTALQCPNARCLTNGNPQTKAHTASHPVWSGELQTQKWSWSLHAAVSC